MIAENLTKAGWRWGCVSALDSEGRTIWIADAHRGDGKRFVVRADEKLTAFIELEFAARAASHKNQTALIAPGQPSTAIALLGRRRAGLGCAVGRQSLRFVGSQIHQRLLALLRKSAH
jgi:hypothetical protein